MKTAISFVAICLFMQLGACRNDGQTQAPNAQEPSALIDLRIRKDSSAPYLAVQDLTVPQTHKIHDGIFPYEGIGWENDYVGYRLFLDARTAIDMFGKQQPAPALTHIDEISGSYHKLAPWGMDILHVGPSRGIGGIGLLQDGAPVQLGKVDAMRVSINESKSNPVNPRKPSASGFTVIYEGVSYETVLANLSVNYSMAAGSPLTSVHVRTMTGALPLTTGIVAHKEVPLLRSSSGPWRYIASYGRQSENKDNLGLALFYRDEHARFGGTENETHFVNFNTPEFDYKFLGVWEKDKSGIKTKTEFTAYLDNLLVKMNTALQP